SCSVGDDPPEPGWTTQEPRRLLHVAFVQELADERDRAEPTPAPGLLDSLEVDPRLGTPVAQDRDISFPVVPECEIRPFDHAASGELFADDALEELASRQPQEPRAGSEHGDRGGARLAKQSDLALRPNQRNWGLVRPQHGDGMRVERNGQ